jgi:hypothetical protein
VNDTLTESNLLSVATGRAIRFGFAAVVLGMSYLNIRQALSLHAFAAVFRDMLGGKPLPSVTTLILGSQPFLIGLSILIPIAAVAAIFVGRVTTSIYLSGVLVLAVFFQLFFTWHAMCAPLFQIIQGMSGGGTQ